MNRIRVPGKVILAGEHAAVRGHVAMVMPLQSRALELTFEESESFAISPGPFAAALKIAMEKALEILGREAPKKLFSVTSNIPPRAGLGSSASLSVAIARFLLPNTTRDELFALALKLEDIFHGKSSGMDVAATLSSTPILFQKGHKPLELKTAWRPHLYLADTNLRSSTKACVEHVTALNRPDLDEQMAQSVRLLHGAFREEDLSQLIGAMDLAEDCFTRWDLIPAKVRAQMDSLLQAGALAVKPTGSGNGGFLLTLWNEPQENLLPLW